MNETQQLADFVANLSYDDLPADVVVEAKNAIRDAVGVALHAKDLPWSGLVFDHVRSMGSTGKSSVWGHGCLTSPPLAAMVNGTAVHGIEMDDRSGNLDIHNGAATVPAALAVAEHAEAGGRDLIVAVVAGYEIAYRVARATFQGIWPQFYAGSIRSNFGAAAAAAKALDLNSLQIQHALGIVGSMAAGSMEFRMDPKATMVKRLQGGGWPAHNGVTSAMLASSGFSGPRSILEGRYGICRSYCVLGEPDIGALTRGLGDGFEIKFRETKPYAAWGGSHSSIDAVRQLIAAHDIDAGDITAVTLGCSNKILGHAGPEPPDSVVSAQFNLKFIVSAAMLGTDFRDPRVWDDDLLSNGRVRDLASRIHAQLDDEIEGIYQATNDHGGIKMSVTLFDGTHHDIRVRHALGTLGNPMADSDLGERFRGLARHALDEDQVHRLDMVIDQLDSSEARIDFSSITSPR